MSELNTTNERDQYKFPMRLRLAMEHAATVLKNSADYRRRELDEDSQALVRSVLDELDSACTEANLAARAPLPAQGDGKKCQYPNCGCTSRATCNFNYDAQAGDAQEYARVREEFELATKLGARFDIDSAMLNVDALLNATRAAPVGEVELPEPLRFAQWTGGEVFAYTAEQVRQAQRDAIAADRAARAQQQAQSVDTPEFRKLLDELVDAAALNVGAYHYARAALIAYIDGRTAGAAPEGWKLVPIEATEEMIKQACRDHGYPGGSRFYYQKYYKSMLSAAPSPQPGKEEA